MRGTFGKALTYGAVLIGLYLAVKNFKGLAADTKAGGSAAGSVVRAFQGR